MSSLSLSYPSTTVIDVAVSVITFIFRAYLVDQSMDHLAGTLKRGGVKDLLAFFPPNRRDGKILEEHFRKEGMPQVADWWAKKQYAVVKEGVIKELSEMREREDTTEQVKSVYSMPRFALAYTFFKGHYRSQSPSGRVTNPRE